MLAGEGIGGRSSVSCRNQSRVHIGVRVRLPVVIVDPAVWWDRNVRSIAVGVGNTVFDSRRSSTLAIDAPPVPITNVSNA